MVHRRGEVISFYPGSGWPAFTPGSVDVKYHGSNEVCLDISEKLVRLDRNAPDVQVEEIAECEEVEGLGRGVQRVKDGAARQAETELSPTIDQAKTKVKKGQVLPETGRSTTLPPLSRTAAAVLPVRATD